MLSQIKEWKGKTERNVDAGKRGGLTAQREGRKERSKKLGMKGRHRVTPKGIGGVAVSEENRKDGNQIIVLEWTT